MKALTEIEIKEISGGEGVLEAMINYILATTPAFQDNQFSATAYTSGQNIYYSSYTITDPTISHEAWHVVQQ